MTSISSLFSLSKPPGPWLQRLNKRVHEEPFSSITYAVYWICILTWGFPIAVTVLLVRMIYQLGTYYYFSAASSMASTTRSDATAHSNMFLQRLKNTLLNDPDRYAPCSSTEQDDESIEMAVVITGCDSGFGKEIALYCSDAGYTVFAGCLSKDSFANFENPPKQTIVPILLDVTNDQHVINAALQVQEWSSHSTSCIQDKNRENDDNDDDQDLDKSNASTPERTTTTTSPLLHGKKKKRYLHALINNAGIGEGFVFDMNDIAVYQKVMDVNYFGIIRCCKAFLPIFKDQFLRQGYSGGRVFNITSMAGLCPGAHGTSVYASSKHAAQALTQSLRAEFCVWNVQVMSINPTFHSTPLVHNMGQMLRKFFASLPDDKKKEYGEDYFRVMSNDAETFPKAVTWNMDVVVEQTIRMLKASRIPPELSLGLDGRFIYGLFRILPMWSLDHGARQVSKRAKPAILKEHGK